MSKSLAFQGQMLALALNATPLPFSGTSLHVALHTSDPGPAGDQTSSEAAYTGYARASVARDASGWTVAGSQASNAAEIVFGECTGGAASVTHVSIGLAAAGPSQILYRGALASVLAISRMITPRIPAGALTVSEG